MTLSITKEQLASAVGNIANLDPEQVRVTRDGSIVVKCGIEMAMRITFELSHVLNLRPGRNAEGRNHYEELIPMNCLVGGDNSFNWKIAVKESVIEPVAEPVMEPVPDTPTFFLSLVHAAGTVAAIL